MAKGKKKKEPELILVHKREKRWKRVLRKVKELLPLEAFESPGVVKFTISKLVQKNLECIVTIDVTAEIPWKYLSTDSIKTSLEFFGEGSEFFPYAAEILEYPQDKMLICYKPDDMADADEFYLCITEEAETLISSVIANILKERQEDLDRSVNKPARPWENLGSDEEIHDLNDHNSRSLLLVELEMKFPITRYPEPIPRRLKLRLVENARDGYIETLSKRTTFYNLAKIQQDAQVQVAPINTVNETQTIATYNSYPRNKYCQYFFEFGPAKRLTKMFTASITWFMNHELEDLSYILDTNGKINLYSRDYLELVRDESASRIKDITLLNPFSFIMDTKYVKGKQIVCVAWHRMWTGLAAVAYADYAQNSYRKFDYTTDEVTDAIYHTPPVLLWSFNDTVEPKLILQPPREVVTLEFCPYDENILVGGCANGQVIVWDIAKRIEKVETVPILSVARQYYRLVMNSMTNWFKRNNEAKFVQETASSDLQHCHSSAVTGIRWLNPYHEITKNGQVGEIPESENRTGMQFITSAKDGTVLCWTLCPDPQDKGSQKQKRKLRRLQKRPSALTMDVSPYKTLNRVMKPLFRMDVVLPNSTRRLPVSQILREVLSIRYEEIDPTANQGDPTKRCKYRAILQRPQKPLEQAIIAGTSEGHFFVATWEGFEFNSGAAVNKEICKFVNFSQYHDGPIHSLSRSSIDDNLVLSVGGKVFALWIIGFPDKPVLWRRSSKRYTHGAWSMYRRAWFRVTRSDGCIEAWSLADKSSGCMYIQDISGNSLTGSYSHSLRLKRNVLGIGDSNGTLRLYYIDPDLTTNYVPEEIFMSKFCRRGVDRKRKFAVWQQEWVQQNPDIVEARNNAQKGEEKVVAAKVEEEVEEETETRKPAKAGDYWEKIRTEIYERELDIVQRAILRNKGLDREVLIKQQQPLLIVRKEEEKLKEKLAVRLRNSKKVYDEAVRTLFPDAVYQEPPPPSDPYAPQQNIEEEFKHFEQYLDYVPYCEGQIREKPYSYYFNWHDVVRRGRNRKQHLYGDFYKYSHKHRITKEKREQEEREEKARQASQRMARRRSTDDGDDGDAIEVPDEVAEEDVGAEVQDE